MRLDVDWNKICEIMSGPVSAETVDLFLGPQAPKPAPQPKPRPVPLPAHPPVPTFSEPVFRSPIEDRSAVSRDLITALKNLGYEPSQAKIHATKTLEKCLSDDLRELIPLALKSLREG